MSTLTISRRVLDFHGDLIDLYETEFTEGFTTAQVLTIASNHHIRVTVGTLKRRGLLKERRDSTLHPMRLSRNGLDIVLDRPAEPYRYPRNKLGEIVHRPSRMRKRLEPGMNPPVIVELDGTTMTGPPPQVVRPATNTPPPPPPKPPVYIKDGWPPEGVVETEYEDAVLTLVEPNPPSMKNYHLSDDIVLRAFWLARAMTGRRIFSYRETMNILQYCGMLAEDAFRRLIVHGYITYESERRYQLTGLRPPRLPYDGRDLRGRRYVDRRMLRLALRLH